MKASTLDDVIRDFDQQRPLSPERKEEWQSFYTETDRKEINLIKAEFLRYKAGRKVLFGGHSGNGKSTELNKFIFDPLIKERFEIIKIDIMESLDPNDIDIVEFLISICFYLLTFAEEKKIEIDTYLTDQFNKLEGFFRDTLKIETHHAKGKTGEICFQGEGGGGLSLPLLKFKADFNTKMRADRESRKIVRTEYRPRMSELVGNL